LPTIVNRSSLATVTSPADRFDPADIASVRVVVQVVDQANHGRA
jgi:hypothetical protein